MSIDEIGTKKDGRIIYTKEFKDIWNKLPFINKQIVRENPHLFINEKFKGPYISMHTSGTTGARLTFPYSRTVENRQWATWWRYREWWGIKLFQWCASFSGAPIIPASRKKPPYWMINHPIHQVIFSPKHLNTSTVKDYYDEITKRNISWIAGATNAIVNLATLIIDTGLKPIESITMITTGEENIYEFHRKAMKGAFPNARIATHYGQMEAIANMSQHPSDGLYRLDEEFGKIDLVPLDDNDKSYCHIIGTGFSNLAFPLLKYDTGDIAKVTYDKDGHEVVESIDGRLDDYVELPDGSKIGHLYYIFYADENIREGQIRQHGKKDVEIVVVKNANYSEKDDRNIMNEARRRLGNTVEIRISYTDRIPRTQRGKLRQVVRD